MCRAGAPDLINNRASSGDVLDHDLNVFADGGGPGPAGGRVISCNNQKPRETTPLEPPPDKDDPDYPFDDQ